VKNTQDRFSSLLRHDFTVHYPFRQSFQVQSLVMDSFNGGLVINHLETVCRDPSKMTLCNGGKRILTVPNAGGNSVWSEVLSFEVLNGLFQANLLYTEMELVYQWMNCKITDYSVVIFGQTVGVSVTRALKFNGVFDDEDALYLLRKKLEGVNSSSYNISPQHSWCKQILHVFCKDQNVARVVENVYESLDKNLKTNTLVILTVTKNANFIYF